MSVNIDGTRTTSSVASPFQTDIQRLFYEGCRLEADSFNQQTTQTPDGGPIVEYSVINPKTTRNTMKVDNTGKGTSRGTITTQR
jgi:hypothetical protein